MAISENKHQSAYQRQAYGVKAKYESVAAQ